MDMVEKLGSGIKRIKQLCKEDKVKEPKIEIEEGWFTIIFKRTNETKGPVKGPVNLSDLQKKIIFLLKENSISKNEILKFLKMNISGYFKRSIKELIEKEYIEYTIPEKPNSRLQKYKNTEKGRKQYD